MQTSVLMINLYMAKEKMYVIGCTSLIMLVLLMCCLQVV